MIESKNPLRRLRLWASLWVGVCIIASLSGCSSGGAKTPESQADAYTESDVPDARRRAINRLRLATVYFQEGKNNIALDEVKQAIAADPGWFALYDMRGRIYTVTSEFALAESSFQRALSINPTSAEVRHNYGVLLCKQKRVPEALGMFRATLADPAYSQRSVTLIAQGTCQMEANMMVEAEASFMRSFEMDANNPTSAYNLALLLFQRGEAVRAQFYARRLNNGDRAGPETLWLGIKIERRLGNREAMAQLGNQLSKRFSQARETLAYERGAFDE